MSSHDRDRSSIFGGLLLIFLGVLFLLHRFDPELGVGRLIGRYWPVLLIVWGISKLLDHLSAQKAGRPRPPVLSGGEAVLLAVFIVLVGGLWLTDLIHFKNPGLEINLNLFSQRHSENDGLPGQSIPSGSQVTVQTGRGDLTIHGGDGDQIIVAISKTASAPSESMAHERMKDVKVVIEHTGSEYVVHPVNQEGAGGNLAVDLDVELPKKVTLSATSARGDINISGIAGPVTASAQNGDVEIHDAGSDVNVVMQKGDVRIADASGSVRINGKGSGVDVSDVAGDVQLEGDFFGPIRARNVTKTTHYASQRSDLTLTHLTGQMELDSGDIEISDVAGSAKLVTHNKDIEIENVTGSLDIADSHGGVVVRYSQPPREEISIANESGEVDLTLPANAAFEISAISRSGEVQNDFEDPSLKLENNKDTGKLTGKIGSHGPQINIATSYGTIYVRRSS